jgi:hypothetical protein
MKSLDTSTTRETGYTAFPIPLRSRRIWEWGTILAVLSTSERAHKGEV